MAVRIITDSTSDIPLENQKSLGIDIVSLSVIFGEKRYVDGIDLKKEQFYEMLSKSPVLPSTSQVNPDGFYDLFKNYTDAGDDVVLIVISSKLSGTYQSAVIAKDMVGADNIYLIDSTTTTFGLALLVYQAIAMRDKGASAKEIYDKIMYLRDKIQFYAVVDTLKYLKMGGRLSSSQAIIGEVLSIKPLVSITNGEVKNVGKERGQKAAFTWILNKIKENPPNKEYPICFGHSNAPSMMNEFMEFLGTSVDMTPNNIFEIGCIVGTHAGPGCVGVAYIS